jgi:hypothetical protein
MIVGVVSGNPGASGNTNACVRVEGVPDVRLIVHVYVPPRKAVSSDSRSGYV